MSIISINQFQNLQEPILADLYWDAFNKERQIFAPFFPKRTSKKIKETMLTLTDVGQLTPFSGSVEYAELEEAYKSECENIQYARGLKFSRKFIDTNQYPEYYQSSATQLGKAAGRTREQVLANIFNDAFSTAGDFVGGDAKALCASDHPVPDGSFTQSNIGTTELSPTALTVALAAMRRFKDFNGEPIDAIGDTLIVPPELQDLAERIVKSSQLAISANNDINPSNISQLKIMVSSRLTDANNWFLVDSSMKDMMLRYFEVVAPEFGRDVNTDSLSVKYFCYMYFSAGFLDSRWIYGSQVS
ncbi:MAG: Mu-like prophage major head subunit gpT family protein [Bacilli bacterium]|jgi:hypothetical protein